MNDRSRLGKLADNFRCNLTSTLIDSEKMNPGMNHIGIPQSPFGRKGERPSPRIPDHEIIRCIGRGSYGEVWLAQNIMKTYRAVKVVYRDSFESDRPYEREFA